MSDIPYDEINLFIERVMNSSLINRDDPVLFVEVDGVRYPVTRYEYDPIKICTVLHCDIKKPEA